MGCPGHLVVRMGHSVVHFRRHFGSPVTTGLLVLELIEAIPGMKERVQFHEGGYLIGALLGIQSPLASMGFSKIHPVHQEFVITDGLDNEETEYGLEVIAHRETIHDPRFDEPYYDDAVTWVIRYTSHEHGPWSCYDGWRDDQSTRTYSPRELAAQLLKELGAGSSLGGHLDVPDVRAPLAAALQRLSLAEVE